MIQFLQGDCIEVMRTLPDESVQCCVTSPPYWGLRDYGVDGQIGLERTPGEYVERMVGVFREVRRVLKDDGTLWLNLGDSYASTTASGGQNCFSSSTLTGGKGMRDPNRTLTNGLKPKDLVGIPWRVAFALQADGWYLRQDIIWHKPNPMPESVRDRCTKSHEYIFLLTKGAKYYYDAEAIREPASEAMLRQISEGYNGHSKKDFADCMAQDASATKSRIIENARKRMQRKPAGWDTGAGAHGSFHRDGRAGEVEYTEAQIGANKRSVWTVATHSFPDAHFATFPPALIEPCIKAGSREGDTVLDPFGGAGTTALVCSYLNRSCISIELNPAYIDLSRERVGARQDMFTEQIMD